MPENRPKTKNENISEEKKEKESAWNNKRKEIERYADALGYGIDGNIKETLVALNIFGLPTTASCEGHIDRGISAPWVEISAPNESEERFAGQNEIYRKIAGKYGISSEEVKRGDNHQAWVEAETENSKNDETPEYKNWREENKKLMAKTAGFLREFYRNRKSDSSNRIEITEDGEGSFRIHNGGEDYKNVPEKISEKQKEELSERLQKHQKEMKEFSLFLKDKYLNG